MTNRFVADEKRIAIYDTERDLYYPTLSIKTARVFADRFNQGDDSDIVDDVNEWVTTDDEKLNEPHESDDSLFDLYAALSGLSPEQLAIAEGK